MPGLPLPDSKQLTQAPLKFHRKAQAFIKRLQLGQYDVLKRNNVSLLLAGSWLEEARTMEFLSEHPHCNFIRYYGCRFRRGHLTGLVLDRHSHPLENYLKQKIGNLGNTKFKNVLDSAFHHMHSLG